MRKYLSLTFLFLTAMGLITVAQSTDNSPKITFKYGRSSTSWVNFDPFGGTRIFIPAKINGHQTEITIATSDPISHIDQGFAGSIGLATQPGDTASGALKLQIEIGDLILQDIHTSTEDLSKGAMRIGHPIPFFLCDELFNELAVDIDFPHHRIAFRNPDSLAGVLPPDAVKVPLLKIEGSRAVMVSIEHADPVPFEFFIGNSTWFNVYQAYYQTHNLVENRPISIRQGGLNATDHLTTLTLDHALFAGVDFTRAPTLLVPDSVRGSSSTRLSGSVGIGILSRFRLIIDYRHDLLYALPNADATTSPFAKDRLGLYLLAQAGQVTVGFVAPGSPSQKAGFKAGETITMIGNKKANHWAVPELANLRFAKTGTTLSFTMKDGSKRPVTLAEFF